MTYPVIIGVRLRPEDVVKLDTLCQRTHRPRADLLRLLITRAEETGLEDVRLAGDIGLSNPRMRSSHSVVEVDG